MRKSKAFGSSTHSLNCPNEIFQVVHIIPNVQTHFETNEFLPVMEAIPAETKIWIQEPQVNH
jgi:hypothetical protein